MERVEEGLARGIGQADRREGIICFRIEMASVSKQQVIITHIYEKGLLGRRRKDGKDRNSRIDTRYVLLLVS